MSKIMATIEKVNKKLHYDISSIKSRQKCFGLLTWSFGLGIYTNTRNIDNFLNLTSITGTNLQEAQIFKVAHYLNLISVQAQEHCSVLYYLAIRLLIFTKTLISTMMTNHVRFMLPVLTDICTRVT